MLESYAPEQEELPCRTSRSRLTDRCIGRRTVVRLGAGSGLRAGEPLGVGTDVGFIAGSVNGTVFNLEFNVDYYLDRNFSIGPMMQITPTGDLFQISFAGVAKYHLRFNNGINVVPFAGFGLLHADLDRGTGPSRIDRNDTSWYIPLGVSLEYQIVHNLAVASTVIVNLHSIDLSPSLPEKDSNSVALMFGLRWGP